MNLLVLVASLIVAPAGFTEQPVLAQKAAIVAGKPVQVFCANDSSAWTTFAKSRGGAIYAYGLTVVPDAAIYLYPRVCTPLLNRLRKRSGELGVFASALEVLTHESEHAQGVIGEGNAECAALADLPKIAPAFGIKTRSALATIVRVATLQHQMTMGTFPSYRGPCDA